MAELPCELEHPGGAEGRHADAAPSAVHLRVSVLGRGSLGRRLLRGLGRDDLELLLAGAVVVVVGRPIGVCFVGVGYGERRVAGAGGGFFVFLFE